MSINPRNSRDYMVQTRNYLTDAVRARKEGRQFLEASLATLFTIHGGANTAANHLEMRRSKILYWTCCYGIFYITKIRKERSKAIRIFIYASHLSDIYRIETIKSKLLIHKYDKR